MSPPRISLSAIPGNFSGDSVGQGEIPAGQTSVRVTFTQPYAYQPIVTITPTGKCAGHFWVDHTDSTGFTIEMDQSENSNLIFNWHSFASPNAQLFVSGGATQSIALVLPVDLAASISYPSDRDSGSADSATGTVVTTATSSEAELQIASSTPLVSGPPSVGSTTSDTGAPSLAPALPSATSSAASEPSSGSQ
jgi:hypothetical protein